MEKNHIGEMEKPEAWSRRAQCVFEEADTQTAGECCLPQGEGLTWVGPCVPVEEKRTPGDQWHQATHSSHS